MEFVAALQQATSMGIAVPDFKAIWEKENALGLLREETRRLQSFSPNGASPAGETPVVTQDLLQAHLAVFRDELSRQMAVHVDTLRQELSRECAAIQKELTATRQELTATRQELTATRQEIHDVKQTTERDLQSLLQTQGQLATKSDLDRVAIKASSPKTLNANAGHPCYDEVDTKGRAASQLPAPSKPADAMSDSQSTGSPAHWWEMVVTTDANSQGQGTAGTKSLKQTTGQNAQQVDEDQRMAMVPYGVTPGSYSAVLRKANQETAHTERSLALMPAAPAKWSVGVGMGKMDMKTFAKAVNGVASASDDENGNSEWSVVGAPRSAHGNGNGRSVGPKQFPESGAVMRIKNVGEKADSGEEIFSSIYYSQNLQCKVRLRAQFTGKEQLLEANVIAYPDHRVDNLHNWPVAFTGTGEILNYGSKRYTPLWEMTPNLCPQPTDDVTLPGVSIKLASNRDPVSKVTLAVLRAKTGYVDNQGSITLRWNVSCFEDDSASSLVSSGAAAEATGNGRVEPPQGMW